MSTFQPSLIDENEAIAKKWILTLLVPFSNISIIKNSYRSEEIAEYILGGKAEDMSFDDKAKELQTAYKESQTWQIDTNTQVDKGVAQLQEILKLNETEAALLKFATIMYINKPLRELCGGLSDYTKKKFCDTFAQLLDRPEHEILEAIKSSSKLFRFGIFDDPNFYKNKSVDDCFSIDNDYIIEAVIDGHVTVENLLKKSAQVVNSDKLDLKDYEHVKESVDLLLLYLKNKLAAKSKGGNILLYGPPGTGKTELSRLLAREVGAVLHEVRVDEIDGNFLTGKERMMQYLFSQALLEPGSNLMVFDEFEDSFDTGTAFSKTKPNKGWINNILESNNTPCIWICNDLYSLHDAYLRRFDLVLQIKAPDMACKTKLITSYANFEVDEKVLKELASIETLSPAIIERSCQVVNSVSASLADPSATLKNIIHNALGVQSEKTATEAPKEQQFSTKYIQASQDLSGIPAALKENELGARICLFGPPGTGKTAYAHWLAGQLGKPIISKKGSDLIGSYVGETERNIAEAFKAAKESNSVLLLDEVDSFIYDRGTAQRSWETSCVNEMLTQMEVFEGIFIATTNRKENLDPASLRRFDLKVDFDFLSAEQVSMMLDDYCEQLNIDASALSEVNLEELAYLTPGDFAAVKRRSRFTPIPDLERLVKELKIEMSFKEQAKKRRIGF